MKLKELIPNSCFCIIATVDNESSLEKAELFIGANQEVIEQFPYIFLSINYLPEVSLDLVDRYTNLYSDTFTFASNNIEITRSISFNVCPTNRGHMFGTIDLDESCLAEVKKIGFKYMWKINDDMLITPEILDKSVIPGDFYYVPGFSYETLCKTEFIDNFIANYERSFYTPQSTFFILDVSKVDTLYGDVDTRKKIWEEGKINNTNLRPWEVPQPDGIKFGLEDMLGYTTKDLYTRNLLSSESFNALVNHVGFYKEGDPSHKNIMLKEIGVCHYHYWKDKIFKI